jgi:hypothetical protein
MKKHVFCLIILCITTLTTIKAQDKNGTLNVGVGILPGIGGSLSYDHQVKNIGEHSLLTLGGYVGFSRRDGYGLDGSNSVDFWESKSLLAPRITCQYAFGQQFEVFAALMPGLSIDRIYFDKTELGFFIGVSAGCRVKLSKNMYIFAETGYNVLSVNTGLSFKF